MNKLRPFFVFATVWHVRGEDYNVSNHYFYVVALSEKAVKQMVDTEVEGYMHWKHHLTIEEIKTDKKQIRRLATHMMESRIMNEAVEKTLKLNKKKHAALREKCEEERRSSCSRDLKDLFKFPSKLYETLAVSLQPGSKVVIEDGRIYVYRSKKREITFRDIELEREREKVRVKIKDAMKDI